MSWTGDGAGNLLISGSAIHYNGSGGKKGNALWSKGGTGSWEFRISGPSGIWIGVSMPAKFGPGYGMKGLFYGGPGNLSDGNSLVAGQWGPKYEEGDIIGMRIEQNSNKISISFSKNDQRLGIAFDINDWRDGELYPAISMDQPGQGAVLTEANLPNLEGLSRSRVVNEGVEGSWEGRFKLNVEKSGEKEYNLTAKISNVLSCTLTEINGKFSVGNIMSTLMLPPPEMRQLEEEVGLVLADLTGLRREGSSLILEGAGKQEIFQTAAAPGHASRENINWMK